MMKLGMKLMVGIATAGMLMATGAMGVQSLGGLTCVDTVETVEYKMEENLYLDTPVPVKALDEITDYKYLSDVEKNLPKGYGHKRVKLRGYDIEGLLVVNPDQAIKDPSNGEVICNQAKIYTEKPGRNVKCIGEIYTDGPIRISDGVLYGVGIEGWLTRGNSLASYLSFVVSGDGEKLIVKDYICFKFENLVEYYGFTNHDGNNNYHALTDYDDAIKALDNWEDRAYAGEMLLIDIKG